MEKDTKTNLVFQFSSIGSLGVNESSWLCKEFYNSLNTAVTAKTDSSNKPICVNTKHSYS